MKLTIAFGLVLCGLLVAGCVTNDFKVLDALRVGMTKTEASAAIAAFGFRRDQILERPIAGWGSDGTFTNLPSRARALEQRSKRTISTAEYYPVGHGMLGAGMLFLFYGEDGRLLDFYRYQIN